MGQKIRKHVTTTPEQRYFAEASSSALTDDQLRRRAMLLGGNIGSRGTGGDVTTIEVRGENSLGPTYEHQRYFRGDDGKWRVG